MLSVALVCLAIAPRAEARSLTFGPRISFPVPAGDVGSEQLGLDVGLMVYSVEGSRFSKGIEVGYQYWPATRGYMLAYDEYLKSWFQTIDSATWAFSALDISGHLKVFGPTI